MRRPPPERTLVALVRRSENGGRNEHRTTESSLHERPHVGRTLRLVASGGCRDAVDAHGRDLADSQRVALANQLGGFVWV